ncbi:MAG: hypothetical protein Q8O03_00670 [Nanoarchaeota archaeon]|nr:hypothetical protein [Nanoarchaeota archaeon]
MDKEQATKLLVEQLVKTNGQTFVTDTAHKKHFLEKAVACSPIEYEKPFTLRFAIDFLCDSRHTLSNDKLENIVGGYKEKLIKHCSKVSDANYVFVENSQSVSMAGKYSDNSCLSLMGDLSFFALIGEKEVKNLQRMFYKDVDPNIIRAMNTLGIRHFVNSYKSYKKEPYFMRDYRPSDSLDSFLEFVFTIPYEDQNIENNKEILRRIYYHTDFVEILTKEYSNGKYFEEYFNCLDKGNKKTVFDNLKNIQERKPVNDSFLWSQGFKELQLNYLEMYKDNTKDFIDYFSNKNLEEKKIILKDIMNCEFTNEEVVKWLNENYLDLVREVGFNG